MSDAVYKVTIVSYRLTLLAFLGAYLAYGIFATIFEAFLPPVVLLVVFFVMFVVAYLWLKWVAINRRGTILSSLPQVLADQRKSTKIRWDDIKSISLIRRRNARISVGLHVYRATIRESDYESLNGLLLTKIGDRLAVREGALR